MSEGVQNVVGLSGVIDRGVTMKQLRFDGVCDISAAVLVPGGRTFLAGSDEERGIRVLDLDTGRSSALKDLTAFLGIEDEKEIDLEGAARLGTTVLWIGSHSLTKKAKPAPSRRRLFATTLAGEPIGVPFKNLLADLFAHEPLKRFNLEAASQLAPEAPNGLNIEGLAPWGTDGVLVGFRNPIRDQLALAVPVLNPVALTSGTATKALLGDPVTLRLGGAGIRAFEFVPQLGVYFILAGDVADGGKFTMYQWTGSPSQDPVQVGLPPFEISPEELLVEQQGTGFVLHLLSDDGDRLVGGKSCKDVEPVRRSCRGLSLAWPSLL